MAENPELAGSSFRVFVFADVFIKILPRPPSPVISSVCSLANDPVVVSDPLIFPPKYMSSFAKNKSNILVKT